MSTIYAASAAAPSVGAGALPRELVRWLQSLDLPFAVKHPKRDLSNGFLVAHICARFYPSVDLRQYDNATSRPKKEANWAALRKALGKAGVTFPDSLVEGVISARDGAADELLNQLYTMGTSRKITVHAPLRADAIDHIPAFTRVVPEIVAAGAHAGAAGRNGAAMQPSTAARAAAGAEAAARLHQADAHQQQMVAELLREAEQERLRQQHEQEARATALGLLREASAAGTPFEGAADGPASNANAATAAAAAALGGAAPLVRIPHPPSLTPAGQQNQGAIRAVDETAEAGETAVVFGQVTVRPLSSGGLARFAGSDGASGGAMGTIMPTSSHGSRPGGRLGAGGAGASAASRNAGAAFIAAGGIAGGTIQAYLSDVLERLVASAAAGSNLPPPPTGTSFLEHFVDATTGTNPSVPALPTPSKLAIWRRLREQAPSVAAVLVTAPADAGAFALQFAQTLPNSVAVQAQARLMAQQQASVSTAGASPRRPAAAAGSAPTGIPVFPSNPLTTRRFSWVDAVESARFCHAVFKEVQLQRPALCELMLKRFVVPALLPFFSTVEAANVSSHDSRTRALYAIFPLMQQPRDLIDFAPSNQGSRRNVAIVLTGNGGNSGGSADNGQGAQSGGHHHGPAAADGGSHPHHPHSPRDHDATGISLSAVFQRSPTTVQRFIELIYDAMLQNYDAAPLFVVSAAVAAPHVPRAQASSASGSPAGAGAAAVDASQAGAMTPGRDAPATTPSAGKGAPTAGAGGAASAQVLPGAGFAATAPGALPCTPPLPQREAAFFALLRAVLSLLQGPQIASPRDDIARGNAGRVPAEVQVHLKDHLIRGLTSPAGTTRLHAIRALTEVVGWAGLSQDSPMLDLTLAELDGLVADSHPAQVFTATSAHPLARLERLRLLCAAMRGFTGTSVGAEVVTRAVRLVQTAPLRGEAATSAEGLTQLAAVASGLSASMYIQQASGEEALRTLGAAVLTGLQELPPAALSAWARTGSLKTAVPAAWVRGSTAAVVGAPLDTPRWNMRPTVGALAERLRASPLPEPQRTGGPSGPLRVPPDAANADSTLVNAMRLLSTLFWIASSRADPATNPFVVARSSSRAELEEERRGWRPIVIALAPELLKPLMYLDASRRGPTAVAPRTTQDAERLHELYVQCGRCTMHVALRFYAEFSGVDLSGPAPTHNGQRPLSPPAPPAEGGDSASTTTAAGSSARAPPVLTLGAAVQQALTVLAARVAMPASALAEDDAALGDVGLHLIMKAVEWIGAAMQQSQPQGAPSTASAASALAQQQQQQAATPHALSAATSGHQPGSALTTPNATARFRPSSSATLAPSASATLGATAAPQQ